MRVMKVKNKGKKVPGLTKFFTVFTGNNAVEMVEFRIMPWTGKLSVRHSHIVTVQKRHILPRKGWVFNIVVQMHSV